MNRLDRAFIRAHRSDARSKQGSRCKYCLDPLTEKTATADHVVPRRYGGVDHRHNIAAADRTCNRLKGHMSAKQFMKRLRDPEPGAPLELWLQHMRYRVNTAVIRAERRILASVGMKP